MPHCKFKRVVLPARGNFRPFCKRVVLTLRKGRFNSEGSFDPIKGSKYKKLIHQVKLVVLRIKT